MAGPPVQSVVRRRHGRAVPSMTIHPEKTTKGATMKNIAALSITLATVGATLVGCGTPASTTSDNLSKAADNFEVNRRITFVNGITDKQLMIIEGYCSVAPDTGAKKLDVTCKVGGDKYRKHFLGLSDNVFYFVEQIEDNTVDPNHYRVFWRPEILIPNIDRP